MNITVTDDEILEDDESFEMTLEPTPDLDSRIILGPATAEINIIDDDGVFLYTVYSVWIGTISC